MLEVKIRAIALRGFERLLSAKILADRDELHFRSNDAFARVRELCHGAAIRSLSRLALQAWERFQPYAALAFLGVFEAEVAVVFRTNPAAYILDGVGAIENPL